VTGLTSMITEDRIRQILGSSETLDEAADRLIQEANEAGGRDNITVVLTRVEEVENGDRGIDQPTVIAPPSAATAAAPPADGGHTAAPPPVDRAVD